MKDSAGDGSKAPAFYLAAALAALLLPAALGSSATIFYDGVVSWHIATGQWILDHRVIPQTDPFSFTWAGKPWVPIEWLAEVAYASAYRLAGYSGVAALVTAALMALHSIVFFNASRSVSPWMAAGTVVLMDLVLIPMMLARPHLIAWALLAFWMWLMLRARERGRAPPLPAALLLVVWANLHGSFAIALLIAAVFGLEAVLASPDRARAIRQWGLFGAACAAAVLVNANGIEGVLHPLRIANLAMLPLIDEWKPSNPAVTPFFFGVLGIAVLVSVFKRPRMHPVRWGLLALLTVLAFVQMRHQAVLAIVAAMLLPPALAKGEPAPALRIPVLLAAGAMALFVTIRAVLPVDLPYNSANPWKMIAAIPPELRSQPVLNGYAMGGPLILSGIRPYVDGRGDMYGDALVVDYRNVIRGDPVAFDRAVQRWGIRWAILPNNYSKLIGLLDRSAGWRRTYADEVGVIYVRN